VSCLELSDGTEVPTTEFESKQKAWDEHLIKVKSKNLSSRSDQVGSSGLLAATGRKFGIWLHAIPMPP